MIEELIEEETTMLNESKPVVAKPTVLETSKPAVVLDTAS